MSVAHQQSLVAKPSCPVLRQMSPGTKVEVEGGTAELFVAGGDIGAVSYSEIAEIAGSRATHVLSVFCNGGLWARRDLYFVDARGALVGGYQYASTTHGGGLQRLPDSAAEFNKVVGQLAANLLSMPERP